MKRTVNHSGAAGILLWLACFLIIGGGCRKVEVSSINWQAFDGQRAFAHVAKQVALGPRPPGTEAYTQMQRYIIEQLQTSGLTVQKQEFEAKTPRGPMHFTNLIVEIRGQTAPVLLAGAHYDTKYFANQQFVGANDGASGVGVLLEMARILVQHPPSATIRLVFFDGEEAQEHWSDTDGLYGSRHFADELQRTKEAGNIRAAFVLDMIGDQDLTVTIPPESNSRLVQAVFDAAITVRARGKFSYASRTITDDHTPLLMVGIPAIDLIDFEYGSRPGANDYWHTPQDTLDKLSPESLRIIGQVTLRALDELGWQVGTGERFKF